jgi:hypothetical protein
MSLLSELLRMCQLNEFFPGGRIENSNFGGKHWGRHQLLVFIQISTENPAGTSPCNGYYCDTVSEQ